MTSVYPALKETPLLYDFWRKLAYERQLIFERRKAGYAPPWTDDPILANHRFTNAYRASDRVSQYLIREVQYKGNPDPANVVFRTIIFKLFNQIGTWKYLVSRLNAYPDLCNWDASMYSSFLTEYRILSPEQRIWNNAYMITPPLSTYGSEKHVGWLDIIDTMVQDGLMDKIPDMRSLEEIYTALLAYPTMGTFFAFQWTIDLNYSEVVNFDENSFVVPGLGAVRGSRKLFGAQTNPRMAIEHLVQHQQFYLQAAGITDFPWLGGKRRLHLIDVQNLLCEFDKWCRKAHPELDSGQKGYARIKQPFAASEAVAHAPIVYWYPPKWGLNK